MAYWPNRPVEEEAEYRKNRRKGGDRKKGGATTFDSWTGQPSKVELHFIDSVDLGETRPRIVYHRSIFFSRFFFLLSFHLTPIVRVFVFRVYFVATGILTVLISLPQIVCVNRKTEKEKNSVVILLSFGVFSVKFNYWKLLALRV